MKKCNIYTLNWRKTLIFDTIIRENGKISLLQIIGMEGKAK